MDEMFYGTLPQDTQDFTQVLRGVGRNIRDIGRGVSYYPYDLLGAPVDIINMALQPVGLGSEQPVLGSDYLRNIAQSLGYAQPSTGSGAETAGRFGAAFVNPAAGARAVGQAGNLVTKGANLSADRLVQMITGNPQATAPEVLEAAGQMAPLARMGAIRPYSKEEIQAIDEAILSAKVPKDTYFHGTDKDFNEFRKKDRGLAYYFTPDPMQAASYAGDVPGANIRPVKLDIKKTYRGGDVDKIMEVVKQEDDYYPYTFSKMREFLEEQDPKAFHTPSVVKALKKLGYDSFVEYEGGVEQIGVFSAKAIKPSFGGLLDDTSSTRLLEPEATKSLLDNPNLKNWVKGSDAVKESGEPITLYHATTHDFDTFSMNRANPENHYGKGFYLTDSVDDANLNYAGIGPDLEMRIDQRAEILADEFENVLLPEEIVDMARRLNVDESIINLAKIEENGASPELIREIATKELTTHGGAVMPVFARLQNPVKVGTKDETKFRIDVEFDDDGDIVSESGNGIDLYNSLNDIGRQYDIPNDQINDVWAKISDEMSGDEITAGRVDKIIRENIYDVYTPDGELAGPGQFIADVFRDMGFDGIKMDAGKYFGPRQGATGVKLKGMEGVENATHYIVFEPTQIKSAIGNVGTYSLTDPSILRGAGAAGAGLLGAGMMQNEEMY